ncbi:MAG: SagB/ThcOx family dehydrogenase [Spirochaetes bacterium]|nr:SagB/ThcOx family dehydrogenase [Spirochaetota bacterium]
MNPDSITLPQPLFDDNMSVGLALKKRRSVRNFATTAISLYQLSQILWAANGLSSGYYRTAPSAGATYPLSCYAVIGQVETIEKGLYRYVVKNHRLQRLLPYDLRSALCRAALHQKFIEMAPVSIVVTAVYERTTGHYGQRGIRYVHMEAGHVGQNISLQAVALGLGTVMVGAFQDEVVKEVLSLDKYEEPLYIIPVGRPI